MTKHIHSHLMMMYAEDAMETDKPWERWEYKINSYQEWQNPYMSLEWDLNTQYRRKQKTININGFDIHESLKISEIKGGERYFAPSLTNIDKYNEYIFDNDAADELIFNRELAHRTKEDAIFHVDALLSFTRNIT